MPPVFYVKLGLSAASALTPSPAPAPSSATVHSAASDSLGVPLAGLPFSLFPSTDGGETVSSAVKCSFILSLSSNGRNIEFFYGSDASEYKGTERASKEEGEEHYSLEFQEQGFDRWPISGKVLSVAKVSNVKPPARLASLSITCILPSLPNASSQNAPNSSTVPSAALESLQQQVAGLSSFAQTAFGLVNKLQAQVDVQKLEIKDLKERMLLAEGKGKQQKEEQKGVDEGREAAEVPQQL